MPGAADCLMTMPFFAGSVTVSCVTTVLSLFAARIFWASAIGLPVTEGTFTCAGGVYWPTTRGTGEPGARGVPTATFWAMTTPFRCGSATGCMVTWALSLFATRIFWASAIGLPVTEGTLACAAAV